MIDVLDDHGNKVGEFKGTYKGRFSRIRGLPKADNGEPVNIKAYNSEKKLICTITADSDFRKRKWNGHSISLGDFSIADISGKLRLNQRYELFCGVNQSFYLIKKDFMNRTTMILNIQHEIIAVMSKVGVIGTPDVVITVFSDEINPMELACFYYILF